MIKAHKAVYKIIKKIDPDAKVGFASNNTFFEPHKRRSPLDNFSVLLIRRFWNRYFLDKVKSYLDFIGLNYYFHVKIRFPVKQKNDEENVKTDLGWEIHPEGIYHVLKELKKYKKPIYITENGIADAEDKYAPQFIIDHLN